MKKSQISLEFMFSIGIIFFVFLVIFAFVIDRNKELSDSTKELNKRNDCLLISSLLSSAIVAGDGIIINASIGYNASINYTNPGSNYKELDVEGSGCRLAVHTVSNARLKKGVIRIENGNNYMDIENV